MTTVHDFDVLTSAGQSKSLADFQGNVLLIVNTASKCGFTPQYRGLQQLQEQFQSRGFSVLAFPCNQFANQEPGTDAEIQQFCETIYHVTFPVFAKIQVNGANAHPLYRFLVHEARGVLGSGIIKWNFTKFLVDREGQVRRRYAPAIQPEKIANEIDKLLG